MAIPPLSHGVCTYILKIQTIRPPHFKIIRLASPYLLPLFSIRLDVLISIWLTRAYLFSGRGICTPNTLARKTLKNGRCRG